MQCNSRELFKQLFFVLVAAWVHYHTLLTFIITYQIKGIKYGVAEVVEGTSSKIMESERCKRICSLVSALPGLRPLLQRTFSAVCSDVRVVVMFPWLP